MKNKKHIDKTEHKNNENSIEQLEKNKEIRHKLIKNEILIVCIIIALLVATVAWLVSNKNAQAKSTELSAVGAPFYLATKESDDGAEDNILHNKLNVVKGTKTETYNGEKYFIVENGIISMQIDSDNNMNNQQSNANGLKPGASGKITFYVIPKKRGCKEFSLSIKLIPYKTTDNKTDTAIESESGNEDFQLQEVSDESVCELLKGHILFFENYTEQDGYTKPIKDKKILIKSDSDGGYQIDVPITVNVYWVWPNSFRDFRGIPDNGKLFNTEVSEFFVEKINDEIKNKSETSKFFYNYNWSHLNLKADEKISFSTLNASQFTYLANWYNAADHMIGVNVDYMYYEVECKE